ncbi:PREDICTED: glycerophosphodiester phosphodiesterase GDPDL7-like [Ipomoea nil]|uniref:glycerophosphodiester phosphodiesterase GDPDL7-like n=1 Tax=Ipomoea nil TaxID=35883 RepID=UPI000901C6AC|nr:PREDICTED: glycerophosphodiester phosphodiesterase GDPDL7-like [Ipomoea nil]
MIKHLLLFCLLIHGAMGASPPRLKRKWLTLHGGEPVIVANGGMSGVFPESSWASYTYGVAQNLEGSPVLCDLKLTKDNYGYCLDKMLLQNTTSIAEIYPNKRNTYDVNGRKLTGWFGLDFDSSVLFANVTLIQSLYTRPSSYDNFFGITPLETLQHLGTDTQLTKVWINVEYDVFYKQHKLDVESFLNEMLPQLKIEIPYLSSTEIGFLKSIGPKVRATKTKLFFKFPLDVNAIEPSTKEKYGSVLKKLNMIKTFAVGILVPKEYIWPVNENRYLKPATTLVTDAHRLGLEVFAYGFANDFYLPYNYSLDPTNEYLQFVDNSHFSVDGVVTDFCSTASNAIGCLVGMSHNRNASKAVEFLVISHNGASGDYAGASDLAYQKAVDDGVDIIDCNVQFSKDGVAFCQESPDLKFTTSAGSDLMDRVNQIPEVNQGQPGIFSFELTWEEIKSLKPKINSPYDAPLDRNHGYLFAGKFVTLTEFLEFAKAKAVNGIMIGIENAAYLATKGYDIIGTVNSALTNASFTNQTKYKVMIKSDQSAVLEKYKNDSHYETVFDFKKDFSRVPEALAKEINKYADAVAIRRNSLVLEYGDPFFMTRGFTNAVSAMHKANLSVYASNLKNEFQTFLFDYNSDPYQEIATLLSDGVDGFITDFPATAVSFMRSQCAKPKTKHSLAFTAIAPGELFNTSILSVMEAEMTNAAADVNATNYPPVTPKDIDNEAIPPVASGGANAPSPDTPTDNAPGSPPKHSSRTTRVAPTATVVFLVAWAAGILFYSFLLE